MNRGIVRKMMTGGMLALTVVLTALALAGVSPWGRGANASAATIARTRADARMELQSPQMTKRLAPTVHVLKSLARSNLLQFQLVPSGLKTKFPDASALVTIFRGDRDNSLADTVTVDAQKFPSNVTFTIFLIELANKPFGHVQYVADLTTRGDGSGEAVFQIVTLVAFSMDARNPGSSPDQEGQGPGVQLEHMGMWFGDLKVAQQVLNDDTLKGTIFDGGSPALHAGPQAMTDGQTAPVF